MTDARVRGLLRATDRAPHTRAGWSTSTRARSALRAGPSKRAGPFQPITSRCRSRGPRAGCCARVGSSQARSASTRCPAGADATAARTRVAPPRLKGRAPSKQVAQAPRAGARARQSRSARAARAAWWCACAERTRRRTRCARADEHRRGQAAFRRRSSRREHRGPALGARFVLGMPRPCRVDVKAAHLRVLEEVGRQCAACAGSAVWTIADVQSGTTTRNTPP